MISTSQTATEALEVNQSTEGHRASVVKLGPQATPGVPHHSPWTEVDELWGAGERKMGRGWQRARSMAGAGRTRKNFGLGEKKLPGETIFAESQGCSLEGPRDRVGIGRLMREEAASLFWNVFLGGHSVLYREILGSGEGVGSPFLNEVV